MASAGATACLSDTESHKNIKNWREAVKYLPRIDRAGALRRSGSVLILEKVALRRAMEKEYAGQQQRKKVAVECSNSGVAHSSRSSRGENRLERREKERRKRESLRDQRTVSQVLARSLNSTVGGSESEDPGDDWEAADFAANSCSRYNAEGSINPADGSPVYVGITPHPSHRLGMEETEKKKEQKEMVKMTVG